MHYEPSTSPEDRIACDVICFDLSRPWLAWMMRRLLEDGLRPRLMQVSTGLELANWTNARGAILDVMPSHTSRMVQCLRWLAEFHPHVIRVVVLDWRDPTETLLREAGADWVVTSVLDLALLSRLLKRPRVSEYLA